MKKIFLLIPLVFLYSGGYIGSKPVELSYYINKSDWSSAYSYVVSNKNIPTRLSNYIKMRYFEEIDMLDSALFYANKIVSVVNDTLFYDIVRIYNKTGNDSLVLKYANAKNDSLIKLYYFIDRHNKDSIKHYINILPDTSFYRIYKLLVLEKKYRNFYVEVGNLDYDEQIYIFESLSMYHKAIKLRKSLLHSRGVENIYNLAKDYYLSGDKSRAYYYYKIILNLFPESGYALKSLKYMRRDRKIHGNLVYIAARTYMNFNLYRRALTVLSLFPRYSLKSKDLRAICYYHSKRYKKAIKLLWHKRNNTISEAPFYIGLSYYKMKRFAKARAYLKYYIKHCHNKEEHIGESYYRLAQMDNKRSIYYFRKSLAYNTPVYFTERALFAIYESGKTNLFQDIINQFIIKSSMLTPKMAYTLIKMSKSINNKGLTIYYREYIKNRFPSNYYAIKADSSVFDNFTPIEKDSFLFPLKIAVISGYYRIAKKIIKHSKSGIYYLPLAKYACKSGNYSLSINFSGKYLKYCIATGKTINDSLYYYLFPRGYESIVRNVSAKYNVDKSLIYAIMREESWFQKRAKSRMGAIGVMQILPGTFRHLGRVNRVDYFNLDYNIDAGTLYLSELKKHYDNNLLQVIAHYNGGSVAASGQDESNFIEHIPYVETEKYVKNVMRSYEFYKNLYGSD